MRRLGAKPSSALVRRVQSLVLSDAIGSRMYNAACSQVRFVIKPTHLTSMSALEAIGGTRIFSSEDGVRALAAPPPCRLTVETLGNATMAEVSASRVHRSLLKKAIATYVGNWAVMVRRKGASSGPKYVTVCGFFQDGSDGAEAIGGHERLVKHVHLCTYARLRHPDHVYLFTGTFVAGVSSGGRCDVLVNARSGTWALAKRILAASGAGISTGDDLDAEVTRFAEPMVTKVVKRALGVKR